MKISMGRLVIDKRFSWFVKAGVGVSRFLGADETKDKVSFHVGGGVDIKMAKHWSFQPAAYIAHREMEGNTWYYSDEITNYKLTYLEIPLLFAYKFRLSSSMNWVIAAGPYVDCGINGDIRDVRNFIIPARMAMALSIHTKQKNLKLLVNASPVEQLIVWG